MDPGRLILLGALLAGCQRTDYRPVDRVLALPGRAPELAEQFRICVDDVGERLLGARISGQMVFAGAPAGLPLFVTLDALDEAGAVIAQWTGDDVGAYTEGEAVDCEADTGLSCAPCQARGQLAEPGQPSVVLGITLLGD